jgi:hypothetical protein
VGTTTADQLRALLGPPFRITRYPLKPLEEVWKYPWRWDEQKRFLSVSVSDDGIVRDLSDLPNPDGSVEL